VTRIISVAFLCLALVVPATAQGVELTANAGWVSEYIFRGIPQNVSSASAGLDLTAGPVSAGTWAADVGDGSEVDLYGRLGFDRGLLSVAVGGTGYFYTGDFDSTYLEGNLEVGYGPLTAALARGTHEIEPSADYWFLGLTGEYAGFSLTLGHLDYTHEAGDTRGSYAEAGYVFSLGDLLDVNLAWVASEAELSGYDGTDHTLVLGIGRTFDIR
jgi:hypothetical protein